MIRPAITDPDLEAIKRLVDGALRQNGIMALDDATLLIGKLREAARDEIPDEKEPDDGDIQSDPDIS